MDRITDDGLDTLASFIDTEVEPELAIVDRSTLERVANCPAQGAFVASGKVLNDSDAASSGNEVHAAFSEAVSWYVSSSGELNVRDVVEIMQGRLLNSRPDVQPEVIDSAWRCSWEWCKFLFDRNPQDVIRYDGGKGEHSGQLAWDIPWAGCRVTSELDFLHAGPSPRVLHEVDYKSGRKQWTANDVERSFQFTVHAWLVFQNYPTVDALEVRIFNTRACRFSYEAVYERRDFARYEARVVAAVQAWNKWRGVEPSKCEAWPSADKCDLCPARALCPAVPASDVDADPVGYVKSMFALESKLDGMALVAAAYVDRTGKDILTADGIAFGRGKPKADRKPKCELYTSKGE